MKIKDIKHQFLKEIKFIRDKKPIMIENNLGFHEHTKPEPIKARYYIIKGNLVKATPYQEKGYYKGTASREQYLYVGWKKEIILKDCCEFNRQFRYSLKGNKIYRTFIKNRFSEKEISEIQKKKEKIKKLKAEIKSLKLKGVKNEI